MIIHRQGDANTSHHTAWAGVSGLGTAPKKNVTTRCQPQLVHLLRNRWSWKCFDMFCFHSSKLLHFERLRCVLYDKISESSSTVGLYLVHAVHALHIQFQHQNQNPQKMQGNAGKHDLNFRAPHLWATHCHSASAFQAHRFGPCPCVAGPDTTPLTGALGSFRMQLLGVNIFVGVEFMISPSILGLSLCWVDVLGLKIHSSWVECWFGVASISPTSTSR